MKKSRSLKHLAIIMDGNGRWAKNQGKSRVNGHIQGAKIAIETIEACVERGVQELTLYALSVENMNRDQHEVSFIIKLFVDTLLKEKARLHKNGIRVNIIGDRNALGEDVCRVLDEVEQQTVKNTRLNLNIAFNFSGRWQIKQAFVRSIESIDSKTEAQGVYDNFEKILGETIKSDPDLLIRTGGEMRLSNFMLWHLAYTELFFSDVLWPGFNEEILDQAIQAYDKRDRRYGQVETDEKTSLKKQAGSTQ